MDFEETLRILKAFEEAGVLYVLVGAMALGAHGIPRASNDVDFFISPDDENLERIRGALRTLFDDKHIEEITLADLSGDYPVIRYGPPDRSYVIDLIARLGDAFSYGDIESEELFVEDVRYRVATPSMLYRMKRDTIRPQDRLDAEALRLKFQLKD